MTKTIKLIWVDSKKNRSIFYWWLSNGWKLVHSLQSCLWTNRYWKIIFQKKLSVSLIFLLKKKNLKETWAELFMLNAIQLNLLTDAAALIKNADLKEMVDEDTMKTLHDIFQFLSAECVDSVEYSHLRSLILFKSSNFCHYFWYMDRHDC